MTQWMLRSKRKITGGILSRIGKKERQQRGRDFVPARLGEKKIRHTRTRGGGTKHIVFAANIANVRVNGKIEKVKILNVVENTANPQYVRRNIITKGCIIETEKGRARVTSRPGQHGSIDAVLVETKAAEKKSNYS